MNSQEKIKAAVILDNGALKKWQLDALALCHDILDIKLILNCQNTKLKRHHIKHFWYYIINYISLKNEMSKSVPFDIKTIKTVEFESIYQKNWQSFPNEIIAEIENSACEVIIKFGMNLVTIPDHLKCRYGIISYHHGDPTKYRGRPAGFYELMHHEDRLGIIIQRLSNRLDGGNIYAKAYSKISHSSYKKTAINAYKNSRPLLRKALLNARNGLIEENSATGKNYTLPTNTQALKFLGTISLRKVARLLYGAFFEKRWNILICTKPVFSADTLQKTISLDTGFIPTINSKYSFYADPFFSNDANILYVEALNKITGLGEIVQIHKNSGTMEAVVLKGGHYSYPQPIESSGKKYLLPEIASWSSPSFLTLDPHDHSTASISVQGLESYRLVDATYFSNNGIHYIFAGKNENSDDNLYIFVSHSFEGPYIEHPMNPVVIDPSCARMAGNILEKDGKLYRLGQNNSFGYGNGIWACEISAIDPERYVEHKIFCINLAGSSRGPHTINFAGAETVLDFYNERFSLFAGYRRFANLLRRRIKAPASA